MHITWSLSLEDNEVLPFIEQLFNGVFYLWRMTEYTWLILAWGVYFLIHSILASNPVKSFFKELLGKNFRLYRILYSILATVGLLALLLFNATLPNDFLLQSVGIIRYASLMLATFGVIIMSQNI